VLIICLQGNRLNVSLPSDFPFKSGAKQDPPIVTPPLPHSNIELRREFSHYSLPVSSVYAIPPKVLLRAFSSPPLRLLLALFPAVLPMLIGTNPMGCTPTAFLFHHFRVCCTRSGFLCPYVLPLCFLSPPFLPPLLLCVRSASILFCVRFIVVLYRFFRFCKGAVLVEALASPSPQHSLCRPFSTSLSSPRQGICS